MGSLSELEYAIKDLHESMYQLRQCSEELREALAREADDDALKYLISRVNGWCAVVKTDRNAMQQAMVALQTGIAKGARNDPQ